MNLIWPIPSAEFSRDFESEKSLLTDVKVITSSHMVNTQTGRQKVQVWFDIRHQVLVYSRYKYNLGSKMVCKTAKKHAISYLKADVQLACPTFLHAELKGTITARRRA